MLVMLHTNAGSGLDSEIPAERYVGGSGAARSCESEERVEVRSSTAKKQIIL